MALPRVGARLRRVRSPSNIRPIAIIPVPGPSFTLHRVGLALRANLAASRELCSRVGTRLRLVLHHRRARRSHAPTFHHFSTFAQELRSNLHFCTSLPLLLSVPSALRPNPRRKGNPQGVSHGPEDFDLSGFSDVIMQHSDSARAHEAATFKDALRRNHRQGFINFL